MGFCALTERKYNCDVDFWHCFLFSLYLIRNKEGSYWHWQNHLYLKRREKKIFSGKEKFSRKKKSFLEVLTLLLECLSQLHPQQWRRCLHEAKPGIYRREVAYSSKNVFSSIFITVQLETLHQCYYTHSNPFLLFEDHLVSFFSSPEFWNREKTKRFSFRISYKQAFG